MSLHHGRPEQTAPMSEINMTPLIDVMLVLLIMFIITIPLQTHAVKLDLPQPCTTCPTPDGVQNKVTIRANGALLWNGQALSLGDLTATLATAAALDPQPELHLEPEADAPYLRVDQVLAAAKRAGVSRMGFVGNERYQSF